MSGATVGVAAGESATNATEPPTAVQREAEAQEAAKSAFLGGWPFSSAERLNGTRFSACQEDTPPVGSDEVSTSPLLSTARHRSGVGQETPVICTERPAFVSFQVAAGPAGSVEVRTLPGAL